MRRGYEVLLRFYKTGWSGQSREEFGLEKYEVLSELVV